MQTDTNMKGGISGRTGKFPGGTMVLTLNGPVAIEALRPKDRIITRSGAREVRAIRRETDCPPPMVRVAASALGLELLAQDILLPVSQTILFRDWRAKALRGVPAAAIPAGELIDGEYIRPEPQGEPDLYQLEFDMPEVIYAHGLELPCA
ncbi:MAG: Hint domain-containing protein [Pseudorhodobacter sp.]